MKPFDNLSQYNFVPQTTHSDASKQHKYDIN